MTPAERAIVGLGADGRTVIAKAQGAAIAIGGNYAGSTSETERACTTQDLLCIAGEAAVDMAMIAQVYEAQIACDPEGAETPTRESARLLREISAGAARMCARALEVHARDTGYEPDVWTTDSLDETALWMSADRDPLFDGIPVDAVAMARESAGAIFSALACAPADRMGVPGHIARALGTSVAVFMIAEATTDA